jgi:hypothetical protein
MSGVDWQIPLVISAVAFAAFMIFRLRPVASGEGRASAAALREAKQRILAATDDAARATALADAADACAKLRRTNAAVAFYMRSFRAAPTSKEIVERAAASLADRPGALEKLMWRFLATTSFESSTREAAMIGLRALAQSYAKRPRLQPRQRALEHILAALGDGN